MSLTQAQAPPLRYSGQPEPLINCWKVLEKGSFIKSWLPTMSPKKLQPNNLLSDSGFQVKFTRLEAFLGILVTWKIFSFKDTLRTPETHLEYEQEVLSSEMKPKPSSFLLSYALPVAAMLAIIGALGFGLMMIKKDQDMKVDQLNGKYKSMQFAREKIQAEATGKDLDSPAVGGMNVDLNGKEFEKNDQYLDYPDDPKFRQPSDALEMGVDGGHTLDVNPEAGQDDLLDYPDDPQFRSSFV